MQCLNAMFFCCIRDKSADFLDIQLLYLAPARVSRMWIKMSIRIIAQPSLKAFLNEWTLSVSLSGSSCNFCFARHTMKMSKCVKQQLDRNWFRQHDRVNGFEETAGKLTRCRNKNRFSLISRDADIDSITFWFHWLILKNRCWLSWKLRKSLTTSRLKNFYNIHCTT